MIIIFTAHPANGWTAPQSWPHNVYQENFMNIKNWFRRKVSATARAMTMFLPLHQGLPVKTGYDALAREGYMRNSVVHACIREISHAAAGVPWDLFRRLADGRQEKLDNHPLLDLIKRPNPFQGQFEFLEVCFSHLYLSGNSFVEAVGPGRHTLGGPRGSGGFQPRELYVLRPDRMSVIPDRVNFIRGYEYRVAGQTVQLALDQVLHMKLFHPLDDWYGLSPVQVAALPIDKINACDQWNSALLNNSAVPSGALISKSRLNDEQVQRLREEMRAHHQGPKNARLPLLLEEDIEWKELGISPKDMDWIEGQKFSSLQIAQIYNLPPELIGLQPSTYQNRREARKALYTEVVLPALRRLRDAFNIWLTPHFGADLALEFNVAKIDALSEDRDSIWRRARMSDFLTLNEKRQLVGFKPVANGDALGLAKSSSESGE